LPHPAKPPSSASGSWYLGNVGEEVFVPAEWLNARTIRPVTLLGGVLRGECLSLFDAATVKGSV
jgi:hypothetical protein